jgi:hypothetical protein
MEHSLSLKTNIMPSCARNAPDGLTDAARNSANVCEHPIEKISRNISKNEDRRQMNMAQKMLGTGFAMGLQMERLMANNSGAPGYPGLIARPRLGYNVLTGQDDHITFSDIIGETEGSERLGIIQL